MKEHRYHYTYFIENQTPGSIEKFYIGVRSCDCSPELDSKYMSSSSILQNDIKQNGKEYFNKKILKEFNSRKEADIHERHLHIKNNVVENILYYNKKIGTVGFHVTNESTQNQKITKADPKWKATNGKQARRRLSNTINDPKWANSIGKVKSNKIRAKRTNSLWKETTGKNAIQKYKETVNDPNWKATTGKERILKHKATKADTLWKETTGKEQMKKQRATKADADWIARYTFICPHCGKSMIGKSNFNRWHNDNCKHIKTKGTI